MANLKYSQLEFMALEMASLARARIPLPEGLRRLSQAAASARISQAYDQMAMALDRGQPLSAALAGAAAPPEFVAAVRCAEVSGDMADVLQFAVEHCRRVGRFYGTLATSALYPVIVCSIALPIVTAISMIVVPEFEAIFAQLGGVLPAPTRLILLYSHFLRGGAGPVVLVASLLVLVWACSPWFMKVMPAVLQRLPIFGQLVMLSDLSMLMRFMERMLRRGLPLPTVLRAASLAVWGRTLRLRLDAMAGQAEQGLPVFDLLQGVIPPLPLHLLWQAEQRGGLVDACSGVADYCEDRFTLRAASQVTRMEPVLVVLLGALVGYIVISLYLPLFNIPKLIK